MAVVAEQSAARQQADALIARAKNERRRATAVFLLVFIVVVGVTSWVGEVRLDNFFNGLPKLGNYFYDIAPKLHWSTLPSDIAEWFWGIGNGKWVGIALDTFLIAIMSCTLGGIGAFALSFLAASNTSPAPWVMFVTRRFLEFARTVPDLVFALMFVAALGTGPMAGVLAIAVHNVGALGKLFFEAIETAAPGPVEGVRSAGASWTQIMRLAVLPQSLPAMTSLFLLRFEVSVRSSAVVGFVGGGGIGNELYIAIRRFYESDISALILLFLVTVTLTDFISSRIRQRLILAGAAA